MNCDLNSNYSAISKQKARSELKRLGMALSDNNITYRNKPYRTSSLNDLSCSHTTSNERSLFDTTMMSIQSIPDNSRDNSDILNELSEQIKTLTAQLMTAHQEIDNLNIENLRLKTDLQNSLKTTNAYKKICLTPKRKITKTKPVSSHKRQLYLQQTNVPFCNDYEQSHNKETPITDISVADQTSSKLKQSKETPTPIISANYSDIEIIARKESDKKKIVVLADQQGWKVRELLQKLVGPAYKVSSFWKAGARIEEVLKSQKEIISNLTMSDYIIIIGGTSDCNPHEFKFSFENWCKSIKNTNIIVTEVPNNRHLNEKKLNYELRFICSAFKNVTYIDMNYSLTIPRGIFFALNLSRSLLRQIINIDNARKYLEYQQHVRTCLKMQCNKYTQTEIDDCVVDDLPPPTTPQQPDNFFRM